MKKRNVAILLMGLLMVFITACGNTKEKTAETKKDQWSTIEKNKKIVIGLDDTFVPMGFRDKSDEIVGFDIDLAKAVFAEYGIEPEFQPIDWSMKESELKNGTIDLIWNGYTVTEEREKNVAFSIPYMKNKQELVVLANSGIKSTDNMKEKVLGAQNESSGLTALEKNPEVLTDIITDGEPVLFDTFNDAFMDLQAKRIDGLVIDNVYANYYIAQQRNSKDYLVINTPFEEEDFAVGIRKSDKELKNKIDDAFKKLKKEGKMKEISEKWFGIDQTI
ncbi:amino acid ABC transporter substrate-binding protein [Enterococcus rivorum]|uniref:Amino acid ABC transporter substrate-binding protein n=1 Tax=Enterococcus rivorum TaxID=762845 RepID=A0A1E5L1E6_9ENTE|nr:amino acid ABC transporter substrate-binding protein [Enterococcus rivorum]MBP2098769.1 polar amino acid transport system substrate-binding protein [Enterococcus rivorum]OEH83960.1 amino acid ABC transporter substrate-binding protein [Enterococcus rivorum]